MIGEKQKVTSKYVSCNAISFCECFVSISMLILAPNLSINSVFADASQQEGTIRVGTYPFGIAVNPNTNRVYVANWSATNAGLPNTTLSVIDGSTNQLLDTINVGLFPDPQVVVNPNTNRIYVGTGLEGYPFAFNLAVIDGFTDKIVHTVPLYGALSVNPNTNTVYIAALSNLDPHQAAGGSLLVMDGSTDKIVTQVNLDHQYPHQVAVDTNTNKVYVISGIHTDFSHYVTSLAVIDGSTNKVIDANITSNCPPKINPWGCGVSALALNAKTNKMYVSSIRSENPMALVPPAPPSSINAVLYVVDGSTYNALTNFTLPYPTGIAVNPNSSRVYVYSGYNNKVTVIDGSQDTIIDTIKVIENNDNKSFGIAGRIALNPNTNTIYVTNPFFNSVSVIDGATNKVIPEFPVMVLIIFTIAVSFILVSRLKPKVKMHELK